MGIWEFLTQESDFESLITILPEVEHEDVRHFGRWPSKIESSIYGRCLKMLLSVTRRLDSWTLPLRFVYHI